MNRTGRTISVPSRTGRTGATKHPTSHPHKYGHVPKEQPSVDQFPFQILSEDGEELLWEDGDGMTWEYGAIEVINTFLFDDGTNLEFDDGTTVEMI